MVTKKRTTKQKKHVSHNKTHIMLRKSLVIYAASVFIVFFLLSLSVYTLSSLKASYDNNQRYDRIAEIYTSFKLDESYRVADSNIFGDKRPYDWAEGRTFASSVSYGRDADRPETFADLRERITAAGFEKIKGPGYGEVSRQDHYKSSDGEYIRVSIDTAAWHSALLYGTKFPSPKNTAAFQDGPVYVTIRVNLDDNNE